MYSYNKFLNSKQKYRFSSKNYSLIKKYPLSRTSQERTRLRVPPPRSLSHCLLGPFLERPSSTGGRLETVVRDPRETRNKMERGGGGRARDDRAMIKDNFPSKIKDYSRGPRGPSTNQSPRKYKMHEARIPRGHPSRDPTPSVRLPFFFVIPHPLQGGCIVRARANSKKRILYVNNYNYAFCCIFHIVLL